MNRFHFFVGRSCMIFLCLLSFFMNAQSKKEIKKYKIKMLTEIVTEVQDGKDIKRFDVVRKFDKNGFETEEINYDKKGDLAQKKLARYNKDGDKTEETVLDGNGKQVARETYVYNGYGEKTEEIHYDNQDKLAKKLIYSIDAKGLKTERKTYDAKGKLFQIKKYTYEY
jgi:hypothetical protein